MDTREPQIDDQRLTAYLADQNIPCPSCKYNLRGLKGNCCPECSQELVLSVQLLEPRMGPFLAVCLALGGGLGFNLFLFSLFCYSRFVRQDIYATWDEATSVVISLIVLGGLLCLLIKGRSRFRRVDIPGQWGCGVLAAALSVFSAVWFFTRMF